MLIIDDKFISFARVHSVRPIGEVVETNAAGQTRVTWGYEVELVTGATHVVDFETEEEFNKALDELIETMEAAGY